MFTGIVEAKGRVATLGAPPGAARASATRRLVLATGLPLATVPLGGSIAVDGVCLTVVRRSGRRFEADLGPETLALTTLGALQPGDEVHLERPLRMGDPLGGHLVAGHVDGVGRVSAARVRGAALELDVTAPAELVPLLVPKGSIAVDGVSLTLNRVRGATFSVTLIPHTLEVTCLGRLRAGDAVNLEADLLAKHVARLVDAFMTARGASSRRPAPRVAGTTTRRRASNLRSPRA
jgi:riboflavin synthase alpha subunit